MNRIKIWYSIEKNKNGYVVCLNKDTIENGIIVGSGFLGLFTSKNKKECLDYCKEKGIKLEKKHFLRLEKKSS